MIDPRRWEEVQAVFHELIVLQPAARPSRLAAIGATDPALREAVESLVVADAEAEARLAPLEATFRSGPAPAPDLLSLAGRTISHFHVLEPLGAGGMGVVYRAEDTRLGRSVALKFLLPQHSVDSAAKERFLREAHSAAALDHPNLCTIHEVGESEDGRLFLAMALYSGETLKARLAREGPLPVEDALAIARQIVEGLACAHAAGIVHRDLKPGNVMLLPDSTVKILDFGLAKMRDQSLSGDSARLGTVAYMAPEQIRGEAVDARTDLWALGVILYEMLTGKRPFEGEHEVAIAHAILHDEPVRPLTLRGDVPEAVENLVLRLLAKDPARRHLTADDVVADLADGGRTRDSGIRPVRSVTHTTGKQRWAVAGATALVVGTVAYAALTRTSSDAAGSAQRTAVAVLPFQNLSATGPHGYFADGLHNEILTQLSKVAALTVISRTSVMGYAGPKVPPLRQIAGELGVRSVVEGSVQVVGDRLRVNVRLIDAATGADVWGERYDRNLDDAFAIQSDVAQQIVAAVGGTLGGPELQRLTNAPTANAEAYRFYLQGREYQIRPNSRRQDFEIAEQLYERALALDTGFVLAHAAVSLVHGLMYWFGYDPSGARMARQRAEAETALRLAPDDPQAHVAMGHVHYFGRRDYRRALAEFAIALKSLPNDAGLWFAIGAVHRRLGEWDEVVAAFERARQLNPRDAHLVEDLGGNTYRVLHRYPDAVQAYDRAISLAPDFYVAAVNRGWTYVEWQGQLDTLGAVLNRLPTGVDLGPVGMSVGHQLHRLYWERQADSLLQVLRTVRLATIATNDLFAPRTLVAAWAHQLRGDRSAARAAFDSALVVLDSLIHPPLGPTAGPNAVVPDDYGAHIARGHALAGLGRRDEALREARWLQQSVVYRNDALNGPWLAGERARILAQAGEADAALDEIERLLAEPSLLTVHVLRLDPLWDPIREHPRFRALLAKYSKG